VALRVMFYTYLILIIGGISFYTAIGLLHN
jgi:hypothetical protein